MDTDDKGEEWQNSQKLILSKERVFVFSRHDFYTYLVEQNVAYESDWNFQ